MIDFTVTKMKEKTYKAALERIANLSRGTPETEDFKHWQAHQFHRAVEIASAALKSTNHPVEPTASNECVWCGNDMTDKSFCERCGF